MSKSPWAFKIDYEKSVAEDERLIALYDGEVCRAISANLNAEEIGWKASGYAIDAASLLAHPSTERRATWQRIFGLTDRALAFVLDEMDQHDSDLSARTGITAERDAIAQGERDLIAKMRAAGATVQEWYRAANEYNASASAALHAERRAAEARIAELQAVPVLTEAQRLDFLRLAKAARARHRRNGEKFGGIRP